MKLQFFFSRFFLLLILCLIFNTAFSQEKNRGYSVIVINQLKNDIGVSSEKAEQLLKLLENFSTAIQNQRFKKDSNNFKNVEIFKLFKEQNESIKRLLTDEEYSKWQSLGRKKREQRHNNRNANSH